MVDVPEKLGADSAELVKAELERVLTSRHFRNSRRCQSLLRYVVNTALSGSHEELKERVVGATVFGREPGYDTNEDAVVRNAAAEVRKRLAQYYLESAQTSPIRIELPAGSYAPEFRHVQVAAVADAPTPVHRWRLGMAVAALVLVAGAAVMSLRPDIGAVQPRSDLDKFWEPIVSTPGTVQLCVGQSARYYYKSKLPSDGSAIPASELLPMRDRFLYFGDSTALARIGGYLYARNKDYRIRGAATTPYAELRGRPAVLIGAFNNPWTIRLTQGLRFSLAQSDDEQVRMLLDREKPGESPWKIAKRGQTWDGEEDYAIVSRVFDSNTERWVVAAGGISHFGTMMVGEFLTNPEYFRGALASAPRDWAKKNMQVVLVTKIVNETPGPPTVLATYFW